MFESLIKALRCSTCQTGEVELTTSILDSSGYLSQGSLCCLDCKTAFQITQGLIDMNPVKADGNERDHDQISHFESLVRPIVTRGLSMVGISKEHELVEQKWGLHDGDLVLDLAAGTSSYAQRMASKYPVKAVVVLDVSMPFLQELVKTSREAGLRRIFPLHATPYHLPFRDECFDAVNCCAGLNLMDDYAQVVKEASRILKPGGTFTSIAFVERGGDAAKLGERLIGKIAGVKLTDVDEYKQVLADNKLPVVDEESRGLMLIARSTRVES